ncbi:hypothetical protein EFS38_05135 [Dickeya undicola]|uniref:Uncharacterized protein n=1 Tax=Dickeya undicola TaxID=1577887 RepID=A0A3N0FUC5_9GAMM|nr:hypothetical protein EF878_17825 [Dickeya undicola]RNM25788.1 hypothetical protein EFS38_05135 [Dickeya undicola]
MNRNLPRQTQRQTNQARITIGASGRVEQPAPVTNIQHSQYSIYAGIFVTGEHGSKGCKALQQVGL